MSLSLFRPGSWQASSARTAWASLPCWPLSPGARRIETGEAEVLGGDMRSKAHRTAVCPRIAYMPQGLGKNLYPDLSIRENIEFFGRLFGQSAARAGLAHSGAVAQHRPYAFRGPARQEAFRRDAAKARPVLLAYPRSRAFDPRRADDRRRSFVAPAILGADRADARPAARHERAGRHRLYGGGRALRLARGDERRASAGDGHACRNQAADGNEKHRGCLHRPSSRKAAGGAPRDPNSAPARAER